MFRAWRRGISQIIIPKPKFDSQDIARHKFCASRRVIQGIGKTAKKYLSLVFWSEHRVARGTMGGPLRTLNPLLSGLFCLGDAADRTVLANSEPWLG